ncbi:MAG: sugar phosphate isomerase/epimerase [Planctomycetes bacterium]|nr:sugar phosphate isomerase/epimerase [Planctomycetota bacterium]
MKTGFDMLLWTTHVTEEHFPLLEKIKQVGYDGVEIPIFTGDVEHFEKLGKVIKDSGLACASVTVIPDEQHNPISAEETNRKGAVEHLKWAIDCSAAMNSEVLCGPLYQPLGVFTGTGPTEDEKQRAAEVHRQAADIAKKANLILALEYLNRFECYFLNTMADAVDYVKRVNHPNVGVHYDTFHANIEEKDPVGCISPNIEYIKHVHISENDRGTPGKGHIDFSGTFKALRSSGYDDWMVIEAFGRALPDLAAATRVWRDFFPDRDGVYTEGLNFIKQQWKAAG